MQKNRILVISILAALLVSCALSVAAAQEVPQVPTPNADMISYAPRTQVQPAPTIENATTTATPTPKEDVISYEPRAQGQSVPNVQSATITGPDGETTTVANVNLATTLIADNEGTPSYNVNDNSEHTYIAPEPGMGEETPVYLIGRNTADTSGAATAIGLVVAALAMGAVGVVCLGKHQ